MLGTIGSVMAVMSMMTYLRFRKYILEPLFLYGHWHLERFGNLHDYLKAYLGGFSF